MNNLQEHFIVTPKYSQEELARFRQSWLAKFEGSSASTPSTVSGPQQPVVPIDLNIPVPLLNTNMPTLVTVDPQIEMRLIEEALSKQQTAETALPMDTTVPSLSPPLQEFMPKAQAAPTFPNTEILSGETYPLQQPRDIRPSLVYNIGRTVTPTLLSWLNRKALQEKSDIYFKASLVVLAADSLMYLKKQYDAYFIATQLNLENRQEEATTFLNSQGLDTTQYGGSTTQALTAIKQAYQDIISSFVSIQSVVPDYARERFTPIPQSTMKVNFVNKELVPSQPTITLYDRDFANAQTLVNELAKATLTNDQEAIKNLAAAGLSDINPGLTSPAPDSMTQNCLENNQVTISSQPIGGVAANEQLIEQTSDKVTNTVQEMAVQQSPSMSPEQQSKAEKFQQLLASLVHSFYEPKSEKKPLESLTTDGITTTDLILYYNNHAQEIVQNNLTPDSNQVRIDEQTLLKLAALIKAMEHGVSEITQHSASAFTLPHHISSAVMETISHANELASYFQNENSVVPSLPPAISSAQVAATATTISEIFHHVPNANTRVLDTRDQQSQQPQSITGIEQADRVLDSVIKQDPFAITNPTPVTTSFVPTIALSSNMPQTVTSGNAMQSKQVGSTTTSIDLQSMSPSFIENQVSNVYNSFLGASGNAFAMQNMNALVTVQPSLLGMPEPEIAHEIFGANREYFDSAPVNENSAQIMTQQVEEMSTQLALTTKPTSLLDEWLTLITSVPQIIRAKAKFYNYKSSLLAAVSSVAQLGITMQSTSASLDLKNKFAHLQEGIKTMFKKDYTLAEFNSLKNSPYWNRLDVNTRTQLISHLDSCNKIRSARTRSMKIAQLLNEFDRNQFDKLAPVEEALHSQSRFTPFQMQRLRQIRHEIVETSRDEISIFPEQGTLPIEREAFQMLAKLWKSSVVQYLPTDIVMLLFGPISYYFLFEGIAEIAQDIINYSGIHLALPMLDSLVGADYFGITKFESIVLFIIDTYDKFNVENIDSVVDYIYNFHKQLPNNEQLQLPQQGTNYYDLKQGRGLSNTHEAFDIVTNNSGKEKSFDEIEAKYANQPYKAHFVGDSKLYSGFVYVPNRHELLKWSEGVDGKIFMLLNSFIDTNYNPGVASLAKTELEAILSKSHVQSRHQLTKFMGGIGKIMGTFMYISKRISMEDFVQKDKMLNDIDVLHTWFLGNVRNIYAKFFQNIYDTNGLLVGAGIENHDENIYHLSKLVGQHMPRPVMPITPAHFASYMLHKSVPHHYAENAVGGGRSKLTEYDPNVKGCGICSSTDNLLVHNKDLNDITCNKCFTGRGNMSSNSFTSKTTKFTPLENSLHHKELHQKIQNNKFARLIGNAASRDNYSEFFGKGIAQHQNMLDWLNSDIIPFKRYNRNVHAKYLSSLIGTNEFRPEALRKYGRVNLTHLLTLYNEANPHQASLRQEILPHNAEHLLEELRQGRVNLKRYQI